MSDTFTFEDPRGFTVEVEYVIHEPNANKHLANSDWDYYGGTSFSYDAFYSDGRQADVKFTAEELSNMFEIWRATNEEEYWD